MHSGGYSSRGAISRPGRLRRTLGLLVGQIRYGAVRGSWLCRLATVCPLGFRGRPWRSRPSSVSSVPSSLANLPGVNFPLEPQGGRPSKEAGRRGRHPWCGRGIDIGGQDRGVWTGSFALVYSISQAPSRPLFAGAAGAWSRRTIPLTGQYRCTIVGAGGWRDVE